MQSLLDRRLRSGFTALALTLTAGVMLPAAPAAAAGVELPQASPKARVQQQVGLTTFAIDYASPAVAGREVWGGLVPMGKLWRTGANEATTLTADRDFTFGGKEVKAGTYALYTIPGEESWTVILNANAKAWGTGGYDQSKDVARVEVQAHETPARERLTFLFTDTTMDAARLDIEWEEVRVSVPLQVGTGQQVTAALQEEMADAWRPHFQSARWLLENEGDLKTALQHADASIAIRPTWWNQWVKAQILGKTGEATRAVQAAMAAQKLGKGDRIYEGYYADQISDAIASWK